MRLSKRANHGVCRRAVNVWLLLTCLGVGLALSPAPALAQSGPSGTLSGVVQDPNDAVVSGVRVTIRNTGTGLSRTTVTNEEGRWTFPALPVGTYELTYEVANFKTLKRSNVQVEAGRAARGRAHLDPQLHAAPLGRGGRQH
ncbi:MAG: carboxypeptidase-like regulatory domain-containing protein [Acidobacteria bacterium]|nr:carboxypeptidase-like regulatory domain-containing protein [Acidobacteriota bacterium]MCA1621513.1 carboxypeptidase-like regulatory domain-containing protein [Acidobacteriota bacterium]